MPNCNRLCRLIQSARSPAADKIYDAHQRASGFSLACIRAFFSISANVRTELLLDYYREGNYASAKALFKRVQSQVVSTIDSTQHLIYNCDQVQLR